MPLIVLCFAAFSHKDGRRFPVRKKSKTGSGDKASRKFYVGKRCATTTRTGRDSFLSDRHGMKTDIPSQSTPLSYTPLPAPLHYITILHHYPTNPTCSRFCKVGRFCRLRSGYVVVELSKVHALSQERISDAARLIEMGRRAAGIGRLGSSGCHERIFVPA